MAIPTIDQVRANADYQPVYLWNMIVTKFPNALGGPPPATVLDQLCESIDIPNKSNAKIEINIRGHKVLQSGIISYANTLTVNFVEKVDQTMNNFIHGWYEICQKTITLYQEPQADVEATLQFHKLNRQQEIVEIREYRGVFLEDATLGTFDGSTSDIQRPSLTLSYDYEVKIQ